MVSALSPGPNGPRLISSRQKRDTDADVFLKWGKVTFSVGGAARQRRKLKLHLYLRKVQKLKQAVPCWLLLNETLDMALYNISIKFYIHFFDQHYDT